MLIQLNRPGRRLAVAGIALVIAMSGCSSAAPAEESPEATSESLLPAAEGSTTYPLTLKTPWGETVVQERPERIVALGPLGAELVVALGATPVATSATIERALWVQEAIPAGMDAVTVYEWGNVGDEIQYEEILEQNPDLIVATGDLSDSYDQFSAIAPVVGAEIQEQTAPGSWREMLLSVGTALDLNAAAAKVGDGYDAYFAKARDDNPEFAERTMTYAIQYAEEYGLAYSSSKGSPVEEFFLALGFKPNPLAAQFSESEDVSPELIGQLDADVLVIAGLADEADLRRLLLDTPLFQGLRPVKDDNWAIFYPGLEEPNGYSFNGEEKPGNIMWAMAHGGGPLGKMWAADQLIPILQTTIK